MSGWFFGLIALPIVLAEMGELAPWAARRCLERCAQMLGDQLARERYSVEWATDLDSVPGKITKLGYAISVLLVSVPRLRLCARRNEREIPGMRAACARALAAVDVAEDLDSFADLVASSAVCALGFRHIAVNLAADRTGTDLRCVAACGPQELKDELLGNPCPVSALEKLLSAAMRWETLRFIDETVPTMGVTEYVPPAEKFAAEDPEAWSPEYGLFAPLRSADDGTLIGLLSLDAPVSGRIPRAAHRALVEMFAAHAEAKLNRLRKQSQSIE